jgi:hypothetical protein
MGVFANKKLNDQVAYSLLSSDPLEAQQTPAAERRRSFRRPLGVVATMSRLINGEAVNPLQVLVINTSEHGYGMRTPASFPRGDLYEIRIGSGEGETRRTVRIVSSRQREDNLYDIGAEVA